MKKLGLIPVVLALTLLFACRERPVVLPCDTIECTSFFIVDNELFFGTLDDLRAVTPAENIESVASINSPSARLIEHFGLCSLNVDHGLTIITTRGALNPKPKGLFADEVFVVLEVIPSFPRGIEALHRFMRENIVFPAEAREQGIQGTVFVMFIVERDGTISNVSVSRGIGGGADEEAVRVVSMMPKWTPGQHRGENVRVRFSLPVRFCPL